MTYSEVDLDRIGEIVHRHNEIGDTFWLRYHETGRGQLTMAHWDDHFEWKYLMTHPDIKGTILDFGCGSGHSDIFLALNGYTIVGIDTSKTGIAIAEYLKSIHPNIPDEKLMFVNADITYYTPDILCDSVWASHVFEHIYDWSPIFPALKKLVKEDAHMLISVPLAFAYDVPDHKHHWMSERELVGTLEKFITVESSSTDMEYSVIRAICRF